MIFDELEELSAPAIDHWKSATETIISNELSNDHSVTSVEINIISINGVAYAGRRGLLEGGTNHQDVTIIYEIVITRRVEEEETLYDDSLKSAVSDALESEEYVVALTEDDSSGESAFTNVTSVQTGELIDAFQIRTNYEAFDFSGNTTWCLQAASVALGSMLVVRRCDYSEELQLWSTDSYDQLQLAAFPQNPTCIKAQSRSLFLDGCDIVDADGNTKDETKSFTFEDNGAGGESIKQTKAPVDFHVGLKPQREFMRIRLFEDGVANDSLDKWERVNGKFSTILQFWDPIL